MDADLCRLCRVQNEEPVEDWAQLFHPGSEHLLEKIAVCTNVQVIEHDLLPNRICFRCQSTLELAYTFRIQCDKADARWRQLLMEKDAAEPEGRKEKAVPILEAETLPVPGVAVAADEIQTFFRGPNIKNSWNKRFQCRFCPKHFGRKCRLWEHEAQHTGIRQEATQNKQQEVAEPAVVVKQELDLGEVFVIEELPPTAVSEKEHESVPVIKPVATSEEPGDVEQGSDEVQYFYQGTSKRFQCSLCPMHFARKNQLREHEVLHQNGTDSAMSEPEVEPPTGSAFEINIESSTDEVKYFYRAPTNGKDTWNKRFQCRYCPRHFGRKCRLREHETQHSGIRKCPKCGSEFLSEQDLQAHEEQMHNVTWPFSCDRCGNKFKTQEGLGKHLKWHMTPRNFRCSVCFKSFASKHSLECHKETHQPKNYTKLLAQDLNRICMCPQCGHISHSHNAHVLHLRTHTGESESATESESSSTFGTQDVYPVPPEPRNSI